MMKICFDGLFLRSDSAWAMTLSTSVSWPAMKPCFMLRRLVTLRI